jgi:hypothetical protein
MGYVSGDSRGQAALFPVVLDDLVPEDHPVRVIDAFVAGMDLGQLGFAKAEPAATGRPALRSGRSAEALPLRVSLKSQCTGASKATQKRRLNLLGAAAMRQRLAIQRA